MDLPGVGQNLQDHITANVEYRNRPTREIPIAASSNIGEGDGFIKTRLGLPAPDVQLILALVPYVDDAGRFTSSIRYAIGATLLHPESRGSITLVSKDPTASPAIQPNYLTSEADRQVLLEGFKIARKVGQAEAINPFCDLELQPGIWSQSDDALCAYIRERANTLFHPVGTCKMGSDPMSVVNDRLQVHGVQGLRVVDASIMPTITSGNTNAPVIMIAEKAADLIKQP